MKLEQKYTPHQLQRIDELRQMTPAQWDEICKGCGICCLHKADIGRNKTAYTMLACEHLIPETHRCKIYPTRIQRQRGRCSKVDMDVVLGNLLPSSCGYIEYIFGPAKMPISVDFRHVTPISPDDIKHLSRMQILSSIIPMSEHWNTR